MKSTWKIVLVALLSCELATAAANTAVDALIEDSRLLLDARLRGEAAEQQGLDDATALTLRTRLGVQTGTYRGLSLLLEGEHIEAFGGEAYNSTTNGKTRFASIADPDATELNQAYLSYRFADTQLRYGRMVVALDNGRFFGDVGFRQNQQTFDGVMLANTTIPGHTFRYFYMDRAHRPIGDDSPIGNLNMDTHVAHYNYRRTNGDDLSVYLHLIEMQTTSVTTTSHKNIGLRYKGSAPLPESFGQTKALYTLEYANQSDYASGLDTNDADYLHVSAGLRFANAWVLELDYEVLGGDGTYGFQTPLATAHAFNGAADVFAGRTPANGLRDFGTTLRMPLDSVSLAVSYHDFRADERDIDYGDELDASLTWQLGDRWELGLKVADYEAKNLSVDTTRFWAWVEYAR